MMKLCEMKGKELLDANVLTLTDLHDWIKQNNGTDLAIVDVGVLTYSFLHFLLNSIKSGSEGLILLDDIEVPYLNKPQDRMSDWFFHPIMVIKEQMKTLQLQEGEIRYLEKVSVFNSNDQRLKAWDNGCVARSEKHLFDELFWKGVQDRLILYELDAEEFILQDKNLYDIAVKAEC